MSLRLVHLGPEALSPWVEQLRALERDVEYPVADGKDRFVLSHGEAYHPFFSGMGEAHFLLALEGDRVVGCLVGVRKPVETPRGPVMGAYLGDLKVHPAWRGRGVPARLLAKALALSLGDWGALHWRFAFGAAMRGARGDVMRAAKGVNLMRLGRPFATLELYFVAPRALAELDVSGAPPSPRTPGLDLSPAVRGDVVSTAGAKDFVLRSTGQPWPLVHLPRGPAGWGESHAAYLQRGGAALLQQGAHGPACFGLDRRLVREREFLASRGLEPGAVCTVYALSTTPRTFGAAWTHLATSEI
jgi:GNAT superfamily N-acetyltransferase